MPIFDAAQRYRSEGVSLIIIAGKEYGTGSSRDWAAKGTRLLGVRAVIAQSFERIHRSNLVGMGSSRFNLPRDRARQALSLRAKSCTRLEHRLDRGMPWKSAQKVFAEGPPGSR